MSFGSVISDDVSCRITNMNKLRTDLMSGFIQGLDNDVDLYSRTTDHSGLDSPKFRQHVTIQIPIIQIGH